MEVYALIGPTGTGKSHRASLLAMEYAADLILDDGLLIQDSKILAGISAKRESSALAAVRRAIFSDEAHAAEVKQAIQQTQPERLLVLGTSKDMVHRICDALDLPRPERYIDITEVASPEEIRQARRIRRREGKHVIPAPTFEVKKGFSGYLVDPLRFFYRDKNKNGHHGYIEKSLVRPTFNSLGKFYISDSVIASICERALLEVEGIAPPLRIVVESTSEGVRIHADCSVRYGLKIHPLLTQAQLHARNRLEALTSLHVLRLDLIARRLVSDEPLNVLEKPKDG